MRFAVVLLCALGFSAHGAKFTAKLDRSTAIVGEAVTLTLSFEGGQPQDVSDLPRIDGLQRMSVFNQSITSINGVTTISYSITIAATRPGEFTIPPFTAKVDGQTLTSQPLKLKVTLEDTGTPPPEFGNQPVFLWLVPPQKDLYIGEVLTLEFRLYFRSDIGIRRIATPDIPLKGEGFTFTKPAQEQRVERRVGSHPFYLVRYFVAITPTKSGTLTLASENASVVVNPPDPFDFFGPPPQQVRLAFAPQKFEIQPLPHDNLPPAFNGAVGDYTLAVTAGPTNVAVGDPITVRVQISGHGSLDTLKLPEEPWRDFKMYQPTTKVEPSDQLGVEGTKTFEQIVLPQNASVKQIPSVSFSFFDPTAKKYRTLTQPAIPLTVRPVEATPPLSIASSAKSKTENTPAEQDIVPIKQRLGTLAQISPPLIQQPWFLGLQAVPGLAFVLALGWRKRRESLANNPRLLRQRRVARTVREGLSDLRKFAVENRSDDFFATLFRILQEQLGERLDVPASSITESVIEEQLRPRGVPETTLDALRELFQTCNLARYAPIKTSQELAAFIPRTEAVLRELQVLKL